MPGKWDNQPVKLLQLYDRTSQQAAHQVIRRYSSSFNMASNLLRGDVRTDIRSLYAVVRLADEIVDGAGLGSTLSSAVSCWTATNSRYFERLKSGSILIPFCMLMALPRAAVTSRVNT